MIWKSLFFIFYFSQTISCLNEIRWCTISEAEKNKCNGMKASFAEAKIVPSLSCVEGTSPLNCIKLVKDNNADAVTLSGTLTYKAGRSYKLKPVVGEVYDQGVGTSYYAVAVVKKNSTITINSLNGTKSCHTGYEKTSGWNVPIGYLIDSGRMSAVACGIPKGVSEFFSQSCVPGAENLTFPSLCDLCQGNSSIGTQCGKDKYQDYDGAFRCLVDGGDVAFVKHSTVLDNSDGSDAESRTAQFCKEGSFGLLGRLRAPCGCCDAVAKCSSVSKPKTDCSTEGKNSASWAKDILSSDYRLLCRDGTRADVTEWKRCNLARVPAHAVVVRSDVDGSLIYKMLHEGQQKFDSPSSSFKIFDSTSYSGTNLLFRDATREFRMISNQTYQSWLGEEFLQAMTGIDCILDNLPKALRWCSISTEELWKCGDMARAFKDKTLDPSIQCVSAANHEDCMRLIQQKEVDAVTLDGGDIYTAGKTYGLVPAAAESYSENDVSENYYAVAVVRRKPEDSFTFHELKGRKSCHTGYMRSAGWNIPIGLLTKKGLIRPEGCNIAKAVSDFFSESCVPGTNQKEFPPKLCQLCNGDGSGGYKCLNNTKEQYYGYSGAFRCLVEKGEVAFVKHSTVFENTDGNNKEEWAKSLQSSDFQLLCLNGARAEVTQYADCNWAQVPAHAVMVHPETNIHALFGLLDKAQDYYGSDNSSEFKMFSSSDYDKNDLIFKDSTKKIVPVKEKKSYEQWLGRSYIESIEGSECSFGEAITPVNAVLLLISNILLIMFCA